MCGGTYEYHLCNCFVEIKSILFYSNVTALVFDLLQSTTGILFLIFLGHILVPNLGERKG